VRERFVGVEWRGGGPYLFLPVVPAWVHGGEEAEVWMGSDEAGGGVSLFCEKETPLRLEDGVDPLEDGVVGEGDFVCEEEAPALHRLHQRPVNPLEQTPLLKAEGPNEGGLE
jgi:hypothetical protein